MSGLVEVLAEVEAAGAALLLDGEKVRVRYQEESQRKQLAQLISFLRAHRDEVAELLQSRVMIPKMPPGVRLIRWNLKQPPVAIETCGVVVDPAVFARSSLEQLRVALVEPRRWVGWTIPQLIDRLHQVGVDVALDPNSKG